MDGSIVQLFVNRLYLEDVGVMYDAIAQVCMENYGIVLDMVSIDPHFRLEDYGRTVGYYIYASGDLLASSSYRWDI